MKARGSSGGWGRGAGALYQARSWAVGPGLVELALAPPGKLQAGGTPLADQRLAKAFPHVAAGRSGAWF
jgi:hypothetical protein